MARLSFGTDLSGPSRTEDGEVEPKGDRAEVGEQASAAPAERTPPLGAQVLKTVQVDSSGSFSPGETCTCGRNDRLTASPPLCASGSWLGNGAGTRAFTCVGSGLELPISAIGRG